MGSKRRETEVQFVSSSRTAVEGGDHPAVAPVLEQYRIDEAFRQRGRELVHNAEQALADKHTEKAEERAAFRTFDGGRYDLERLYRDHKEGARIVFKKDATAKDQLMIDGAFPTAYDHQMIAIETFYRKISENPAYQTAVERVLITPEDIQNALAQVTEVKDLRKAYEQERGEAQIATKTKDAALAELEAHMDEYLDLAKYALRNHPQHLELLGIVDPS